MTYWTHGLSNSSIYQTWKGMIARCHCASSKDYYKYGGRGIRVCARWRRNFPAFLEDMGERPTHKHQLDRKNGLLGYSPQNCRWATPKEQNQNTIKSLRWHINGRVFNSCGDAAIVLGVGRTTIRNWCHGPLSKGKRGPKKKNCYTEKLYG